jgi:hypothetical protein
VPGDGFCSGGSGTGSVGELGGGVGGSDVIGGIGGSDVLGKGGVVLGGGGNGGGIVGGNVPPPSNTGGGGGGSGVLTGYVATVPPPPPPYVATVRVGSSVPPVAPPMGSCGVPYGVCWGFLAPTSIAPSPQNCTLSRS